MKPVSIPALRHHVFYRQAQSALDVACFSAEIQVKLLTTAVVL